MKGPPKDREETPEERKERLQYNRDLKAANEAKKEAEEKAAAKRASTKARYDDMKENNPESHEAKLAKKRQNYLYGKHEKQKKQLLLINGKQVLGVLGTNTGEVGKFGDPVGTSPLLRLNQTSHLTSCAFRVFVSCSGSLVRFSRPVHLIRCTVWSSPRRPSTRPTSRRIRHCNPS